MANGEKWCGSCGAKASAGERFCGRCGSRLQSAPDATQRRPRRPWLPSALAALALLLAGGLAAILIARSGGGPDTTSTGPPSQQATVSTTSASSAADTETLTSTNATNTDTTPTVTRSQAYARTCRIKAWYSSYLPGGSYIHFKCVDEANGTTVDEALGSDNIDLAAEEQQARKTAKRIELVGKLTTQLENAGWQQIGTVDGGEWYQRRFGR